MDEFSAHYFDEWIGTQCTDNDGQTKEQFGLATSDSSGERLSWAGLAAFVLGCAFSDFAMGRRMDEGDRGRRDGYALGYLHY